MQRVFLILVIGNLAVIRLLAQSISTDSLVLHLPFNGNVMDVSGNNYNGIATGTSFDVGANGQPSQSVVLDGTGYITIPNITRLDGQLSDFTILVRMWVATLDQQPGVSLPYTTNYNFLWWHRNTTTDSGMNFLRSKLRASWQEPTSAGSTPNSVFLSYIMDWCTGNVGTASGYNRQKNEIVGKWITFTMRYHRGIMEIYHNCERVNYWAVYPTISDLCGTDPMQIMIGLVPQAAYQYGYRYFKGKIDDLRIYKRALTYNEILTYTDTTCLKIQIPQLRIQVTTPDACSPDEMIAKDISILNGDSLIRRTWHIYNDSSYADSIRYRFGQAGTHRIRLEYATKSGTYVKDTSINVLATGRIHFLKAIKSQINLCQGAGTQLEVQGGIRYRWEPCTALANCNEPRVTTSATQNTHYKAVATNAAGCTDSVYIDVKVVPDTAKPWVPTAFSPNGDGLNETFRPLNFSTFAEVQFNVYNRWGQAVFSGRSSTDRWNGTRNGMLQPAGAYLWTAKYKSAEGCPEKNLSGVVQLIR